MAVLNQNYQKIGEAYLGNSGGNFYVRIYAKLNSQDIEANTSSVTYQSRLAFTGSYIISQGQTRVVTSGTSATTTTTNWQNFEGRKDGYFYNGETVVKTITGTVNHDNSTGVASISASAAFSSAGSWGWSGTASGTADLPTIPRNSTITATSPYVGETSQLTVTRYRDTYTHSIHYTFGSLSGYILANGSTTSAETKLTALNIGFPIPTSWYAQMPNDSEKICTLLIKTYNGDTQIGNDYTTTFYVRVNPTTNKPIVTASVSDINDTTYNLTGNRNILVKGVSTASVTWSATAQNSATINNVKINNTTVTTSPYNFTLNSNAITVVATDSRGLTTTNNPSFIYKDYFTPTYTMSAKRVQPTSDYAYISFNGTWFNQSFGSQNNTLTIKWYYREHGTSNWITGGTLIQNTDYKINGNNFFSGNGTSMSQIQLGGALLYAKSWDIRIGIDDKLAQKSVEATITQGIPIVNWESDFFNVNGDIRKENVSIFKTLKPTRMNIAQMSFKKWVHLCNISFSEHSQGAFTMLRIFIGKGNNGRPNQNAYIDLSMQLGWTGSNNGIFGCLAQLNKGITSYILNNIKLKIISNDNTNYDIYFYESSEDYCRPNYVVITGDVATITPKYQTLDNEPYGTECEIRYMYEGNEVYDTNEAIVGTWLNKPLYRKVLTFTTGNSAGEININHNISDLDTVVKCDGFTKETNNSNQHRFLPNVYRDMDGQYTIGVYYVNSTKIHITYGSSRTNLSGYLILEYTKTTD